MSNTPDNSTPANPGLKKPNIKIQDYVRRHTNPVNLRTLHDKGFKKVNLITLKKINHLIKNAVERTFEKYQNQIHKIDRDQIEIEVSETVKKTLSDLNFPETEQQPESESIQPIQATASEGIQAQTLNENKPSIEVNEVSSFLTESPKLVENPEEPEASPIQFTIPRQALKRATTPFVSPSSLSEDPKVEELSDELKPSMKSFITRILEEERQQMGLKGDKPTKSFMNTLQEGLDQIIESAFDKQREREFNTAKAVSEGREEVLERRLEKLKKELLEMEISLEKMANEKGIDPGLASIYQEVQGLNQVDQNYEKKKGLLQGIFEANLKIQAKA